VILLDEIEKAHPEVFNVLLQVLDDGRLTDGQGRTVDFTNTVLIMTSNVGSQFITEEDDETIIETRVMDALRSHFRPEFLNRIDEVVIFHRLREEDLREIVDIQLRRLARILSGKGLTVELTDDAKEFLASRGWDPVYGARPLKRAIQTWLQNPLAVSLLEGKLGEGDHVLVDVAPGAEELTFERAEESVATQRASSRIA
jgi:ATP-dependent Clp protease ATP-binding subunit ClpB